MTISTDHSVTATSPRPVPQRSSAQTSVADQSAFEDLKPQVGIQQLVVPSSMELIEGILRVHELEQGCERFVPAPPGAGGADDPSVRLIAGTGLAITQERIQVVRHAMATGLPMARDLLLALDGLWKQLDYLPSWLPVLLRLAKNKLPLNRPSAMAVRQCDQRMMVAADQAFIYISVDLVATPPTCSLHPILPEPDDQADSRQRASTPQMVMVGCEAPNLGPVVIIITVGHDCTSIDLALADDEKREFAANELAELQAALLPIAKGLLLSVSTLSMETTAPSPPSLSPRRLDIRV